MKFVRFSALIFMISPFVLLAQVMPKNANEQLVMNWFQAYSTLDSASMYRIFANSFYSERNGEVVDLKGKTGPELAIYRMKRSQERSPGRKIQVMDLFSEGSKVVARIRTQGYRKDLGKDYSSVGTNIFEIENGRIAKEWQSISDLYYLRQLGYTLNDPKQVYESEWKLIYKNDNQGKALAGNKAELLRLVRAGHPVRYGYKVGKNQSIEHIFPAEYITIHKEEVYAQNPSMASQRWDHEKLVIWFGEQPFHYYSLVSTDGNHESMAVDIQENKILGHGQRQFEISWFVRVKSE